MIDIKNYENLEIDFLLEVIEKNYGYNFKNYAKASLKRRLQVFLKLCGTNSYMELANLLIKNKELFESFLINITVTVSEMFRDPEFYASFRDNVVPYLRTYPYIKIWCAGCSTGEEAYSVAILLSEASLLEKTRIYATDLNNNALEQARKGIYPASIAKDYIKNYNDFGGVNNFSKYYTSSYDAIKLHDFLSERITFSNHNLVTDKAFGEMNVIFCRNVMIYFDSDLTNNTLNLFCDSLYRKGYLCLGNKETLCFSSVYEKFFCIDKKNRIYQLNE